jgi:hypothetical protein
MLQQKDLLLRQIEQFGRALVQLVDRIRDEPADELDAVDAELSAVAARAGLSLDLASRLDVDSLHIMVAPLGTVDAGRCWLVAELLYLRGMIARRRGEPDAARECFARAHRLLSQLDPAGAPPMEIPAPQARMRELDDLLSAGGNAAASS